MREVSTLHFDLCHLALEQAFTLHVGADAHVLARHSRVTQASARDRNSAFDLFPPSRLTHFASEVSLPADALSLLWVTAPALRSGEPLDRVVWTGIRVPRRYRMAGVVRRAGLNTVPAKLALYGGRPVPLPDDQLVDIEDIITASDAAKSLIFHHPEMLALDPTPGEAILTIIDQARGLTGLAMSILSESRAHEQDPSQSNWITSVPGTDWQTGKPASDSMYVWSAATVEYMATPLKDALQRTKADVDLEQQCWTVQPGITQVSARVASNGNSLRAAGDGEATYTVKQLTPQSGVQNSFSADGLEQATITLTNSYLRWLQVSLDQYGPGGEPVASRQDLGLLSPIDTIMAVPLTPQPSDFSWAFVEAASSAVISTGGLGQPPFSWDYDGIGILLTSIFNYAIPTFFIALGVAVDKGTSWSALTKLIAGKVAIFLEAAAGGPVQSAISGGFSLEDLLALIGNVVGSLVVSVVASDDALKAYLVKAGIQSAAEEATPFVGWIAFAAGAAADIASMVETTVAVFKSPATMELDVVRTMDVEVTVEPDPCHQGQWPATATHYTITITYDDGPAYSYDGAMSATTQAGPIAQTFSALPAGGNLTVLAAFYSDTDWVAGKGQTGTLAAEPTAGSTMIVAPFAITEMLVPLDATTTYSFKEKLVYVDGQGRSWAGLPAVSAPTATVSNLSMKNVGNALGLLTGFGLNEPESQLAYLWSAAGQDLPLVGQGSSTYPGQMYGYQSVSDGSAPQDGWRQAPYGYIPRPCIALPPPTAVNPAADGFLLEPDDLADSCYLRALSLQPRQPFLQSPTGSFAVFAGVQDDLAIHPAGYAIALSATAAQLQIARLTTLVPDAQAPQALIYGGQGDRVGLLSLPVAVTCTLDSILVLQTSPSFGQGCLCAFDFKGNPVARFAGEKSVSPLRTETATVVLLDVSVESKGYVYVLKYLQPQTGAVLADDYRLDIYNPDGTPLTQVAGLAAAKLQVDLWRNLFTLNYEIVAGSAGTEPSVSQWIPSTP
jgi:hypothetical protein